MSGGVDLTSFRAGLRTAANELPTYDATIGCDTADAIAAQILDLTPRSDPGEGKEDLIRRSGRFVEIRPLCDQVTEAITEVLRSSLVDNADHIGASDLSQENRVATAHSLGKLVADILRDELMAVTVRVKTNADDQKCARDVLENVEWQMSNFMPAKGETGAQCRERRLLETIAEAIADARSATAET